MAIQKKSLIGNRAAAKKAIIAKSAASDVVTVQSDLTPKALRKVLAPNALRMASVQRALKPAITKVNPALKPAITKVNPALKK